MPDLSAQPVILVPPGRAALRDKLEEYVLTDLLGPVGGPSEELGEYDGAPRDRYLVGMLAPLRLRVKPEQNDRLEVEESGGAEEGRTDDSQPSAPTMFPSAIGLSFMVSAEAGTLRATARWGRYVRGPSDVLQTETGKPKTVWKREQMEKVVPLPGWNANAC